MHCINKSTVLCGRRTNKVFHIFRLSLGYLWNKTQKQRKKLMVEKVLVVHLVYTFESFLLLCFHFLIYSLFYYFFILSDNGHMFVPSIFKLNTDLFKYYLSLSSHLKDWKYFSGNIKCQVRSASIFRALLNIPDSKIPLHCMVSDSFFQASTPYWKLKKDKISSQLEHHTGSKCYLGTKSQHSFPLSAMLIRSHSMRSFLVNGHHVLPNWKVSWLPGLLMLSFL